ncbi:MAG: hypothetical protein HQK57_07245 [Deltaproteobacteria bacterium]|nr:hypothetical protein [Deltaproteobacteria bacterium]MBF0525450.1 hypothetical protein [Deltaproteobacteria bacterium]
MSLSDKKNGTIIEKIMQRNETRYNPMTLLEHINRATANVCDPESVAVQISKEINTHLPGRANSVWLLENDDTATEIARNGESVDFTGRNIRGMDSLACLPGLIRNQVVAFNLDNGQLDELFPNSIRPSFFPLKGNPNALGFFIIDELDTPDRDICRFIAEFGGMILNNAISHQKIEDQRRDLEEMTNILFMHNAQLSSLHHIGWKIAQAEDVDSLCHTVARDLVDELGAEKAVLLLLNEELSVLKGIGTTSGQLRIEQVILPCGQEEAVQESIKSGRIIKYYDFTRKIIIGPYEFTRWGIFPIKCKGHIRGVAVVELGNKDISDIVSILVNHAGMILDNLIVLEDRNRIYACLQEANVGQERLISELQAALVEVKTLRGIIPICSNCLKVRDDKGYWQRVEKYIQDRTDAEFSHSLCSDCVKELYPDLYEEVEL